ncbi:MAG: matrixin family metalloprotease [Enhydrobacter sp.]|nr:matrixin family metalloprotease [Enhydrobacter sp.]
MPVVTDYTALLSGHYWNGIEVTGKPVIVTYSFPTTAAGYLADVDGFTAATVSSFEAFNGTEQGQARTALGEWAAASGLIFVEVAPGQGDINFQLVDFDTTSAPSYAGEGGIGFYPFGDWNFFTYPNFSSDMDGSGDVFMNSQFASGGSVAYGTLLHEIGHAIGLKHPTEVVTNYAANPVVTHDQVLASDDPALTIMAEVGGSGISDHLKTLDQQAAAFIYGPAGLGQVVTSNASGANTAVSSWSWNASKQRLTQVGFAGDDIMRGSSVKDILGGLDGNDALFGLNGDDTLDGGAGDDLLNGGPGKDKLTGGTGDDTFMVDGNGDKVIELVGEGFDSVLAGASFTLSHNLELLQLFGAGLTGKGNDLGNTMFGDGSLGSRLYGLDGDDYMVGGSGTDTLDGGTGSDAMFGGAGNDSLVGGAGADTLVGDAGQDRMTGGADVDTFRFALGDSLATTVGYDTVQDFETGIDRIDLSIFSGTPSASAYAEIAVASNKFATLKAAAETQLGGSVEAVFVAGNTKGWLFWNTDATAGTAEEAVLLAGRNNLNDFASGDLF